MQTQTLEANSGSPDVYRTLVRSLHRGIHLEKREAIAEMILKIAADRKKENQNFYPEEEVHIVNSIWQKRGSHPGEKLRNIFGHLRTELNKNVNERREIREVARESREQGKHIMRSYSHRVGRTGKSKTKMVRKF